MLTDMPAHVDGVQVPDLLNEHQPVLLFPAEGLDGHLRAALAGHGVVNLGAAAHAATADDAPALPHEREHVALAQVKKELWYVFVHVPPADSLGW